MRKVVSKLLPNSNITTNLSLLNFKLDYNSIEEFYINLDNPHKTWLPGDEVSGQIILITKKNLANIVVTLTLTGTVKINPSSHSKLRSLKHVLFKHTIMIYGNDNLNSLIPTGDFSNGLHKGEHRFPFIVKLPIKKIFTSIDFGKGSISYSLLSAIGNTPQKPSSFSTPTPSKSNSPIPPRALSFSFPTQFSSSASASLPAPPKSPLNPHSPVSPQLPSSSESNSNKFFKSRNITVSTNPNHVSEKIINIISPIDVTKLPPPKPKRLIIRDPQASRSMSRTQSSASTIQTQSTTSSADSSANSPANELSIGAPSIQASSDVETLSPLQKQLSTSSLKSQSIKVSLDINQRGYIRGEPIPIKISLNHTRQLQDLNGIILTFVRVCRLDNGPESFLESFRKDLQQSVLPLYIDPNTLSAEVNTSVRIPPDAFPTIVGCPLVSFQYFVEVMVNLSGKTVDIHGSNTHTNTPALLEKSEKRATPSLEFDKFTFNNSTERSAFINTDKFKRSKRFLQLNTEIIVGTHRLEKVETISRRSSLSASSPLSQNMSPNALPQIELPTNSYSTPTQSQIITSIQESVETNFQSPPYVIPGYNDIGTTVSLPVEPELSEKERVRAHEMALMPSAPDFDENEDEDIEEGQPESPIEENTVVATGSSISHSETQHQYQFFFDSTDVSLYDEPWPNVQGDSDYVPKYENSNDDRVVSPTTVGTGTNSNESDRADS